MKTVNIIIADDHQLIIDALKAYLEKTEDINVIATASNSDQLLKLVNMYANKLDVILLDYHMPTMSIDDLLLNIKKIDSELKTVILSSEKKIENIITALNNDALGYVLKDCDKKEIKEAILAAKKAKNYFSSEIKTILSNSFIQNTGGKSQNYKLPISDRELEILNLTSNGLTNHEISDELGISFRTVDTHKRNMLKKTGAKNITHLVKLALKFKEIKI